MAKMVTCSKCHSQFYIVESNQVKCCPSCGNNLTTLREETREKNWQTVLAIVLTLACGMAFIAFLQARVSDRETRQENAPANANRTYREGDRGSTEQFSERSDQIADKGQKGRTSVAESVSQSAAGSSGVASGTTMQSPEISAKGVTPELKEFLDEYEAIIDQYIVMAQKAGAPGQSDPTILMDYFNLLYRLADFEKKTAEYNQEEMTDADAKYYMAVMYRIEMKLLEAAGRK